MAGSSDGKRMTRNAKWSAVNASALLLGLGSFTAASFADAASDQWLLDALVDAHLLELSGSVTLPTGRTAHINVDPHELISSLNFASMGAFEARRALWIASSTRIRFCPIVWRSQPIFDRAHLRASRTP